MLNSSSSPNRFLLALLGATLLAAGCGNGNSEDAAAKIDLQADRENVEAMAREHADDSTTPSEAAQIAPQKAVISERLPYAEVGEELVYGHFVFPADMVEPLPAVIVIHEWWGLNDNVKAMSDRLAAEGYIVLAVDLYGGKIATSPTDARTEMIRVVEDSERAAENIRQAYDFVNSIAGAPKIGSLGWCFGGGWSLSTAMLFPDDLDASVIYYGQVTANEDELRPVSTPILGLFGEADKGIPVSSVREFEAALGRLRKDYEIHIYPDAEHAFANPTGDAYDRDAAEDAWLKTLAFLKRNLGESNQ
ncbi:MAG: dienelactone hydrolase family protein [Woeseiaceae bacterium]